MAGLFSNVFEVPTSETAGPMEDPGKQNDDAQMQQADSAKMPDADGNGEGPDGRYEGITDAKVQPESEQPNIEPNDSLE